jgi:hypothetical protein
MRYDFYFLIIDSVRKYSTIPFRLIDFLIRYGVKKILLLSMHEFIWYFFCAHVQFSIVRVEKLNFTSHLSLNLHLFENKIYNLLKIKNNVVN